MPEKRILSTNYNETGSSTFPIIIRKYLPDNLFNKLKQIKNNIRYILLNIIDSKSYMINMNKLTDQKIKNNTLINTHIIEKGLSHHKIRYNFGKKPLERLVMNLNELKARNLKISMEYNYALSTLSEYFIIHEQNGQNLTEFSQLLGKELLLEVRKAKRTIGGTFILNKDEKKYNRQKNFSELASGRYTVRNFENSEVDFELIKEAIKLAQKSPSACNRQPSKVIAITNENIIKSVLDLQGGFRGYDLPKVVLISLIDLSAYSSYTDRYTGYIDGGLFTMSVIYGLEYVGLGACLLNTAFDNKKEAKIRKILQIEDADKFITLIAVGNIPEATKVAKSHRINIEDILKVIS